MTISDIFSRSGWRKQSASRDLREKKKKISWLTSKNIFGAKRNNGFEENNAMMSGMIDVGLSEIR